MNRLRLEFQDRVNFVILDWDTPVDFRLGLDLGFRYHPNFAAIAPNSNDVEAYLYAAPRSGELREMIEELLEKYGG